MKITRAFIKGTNWALAGLISVLGFTGCERNGYDEYGVPSANYTVKGKVVDKASGKPIAGIRVGYDPESRAELMYGVKPTPYRKKAHVITDAKGDFKLTDRMYEGEFPLENNHAVLPVFVEDIDGEKNGLYNPEIVEVDFKDATQSGKQKNWHKGEYAVTVNVELTEQKTNE